MTTEGRFAYVGRWHSCDCVAAVCMDMPDHPKDTAKAVSDYIRRGYRVERLPSATVREMPWRCDAHPKGTPYPWDLDKIAAKQHQAGLGL